MAKKVYYKEIEGQIVFYKGEKIILGEWQIINPTDEQLEQVGWLEYIPSEHPEPEQTLLQIKEKKILQIEEYDNSSSVNEFYILYNNNTIPFWGSKADRVSLQRAVEDYIEQGLDNYRLDIREMGISLTIPCDKLLEILRQLEVYAAQCYNTTTDHIYAVNALTTIEEVENYDNTLNYPEKLTFEIEEYQSLN